MSDFVMNLVRPEMGNLYFKISKFPDGQQDITINSNIDFSVATEIGKDYSVTIKSRLSSFRDLELILCSTAALKRMGIKKIRLYIPYILGARSDRKFVEGGTSYLRDVLAPILNSQNYEKITCIDVHSDVADACINNLEMLDNYSLFSFALRDYFVNEKNLNVSDYSKFLLVSPDAGAVKKIYKLSEKIKYEGDVIICSKHRDTNGKLSKTIVPVTPKQHTMIHDGPYKDFFIVDDICDGGNTFINIAKEIQEYYHASGKTECNIYLIVSHGIFSAGLLNLSKYFKKIYTTNSFKDIEASSDSDYTVDKNFVLQQQIF